MEQLPFRYASVDHWPAFNEVNSGPVALAKARLEEAGRREDVREQVRSLALDANRAKDGGFLLVGEYLLAVVDK